MPSLCNRFLVPRIIFFGVNVVGQLLCLETCLSANLSATVGCTFGSLVFQGTRVPKTD